MSKKKETELEPGDYLYQPEESPFRTKYAEWTERWWNWLLGIPKDVNPANDHSGKNGTRDQPKKDVWFLAGAVNGKAKRKISIPANRAILCPVVNYEWSLFEMLGFARQDVKNIIAGAPVKNEELKDLRELAKDYLDDMYSLDVIIDEGEDSELKLYTGELCKYRIFSDFDATFTQNNIYNTQSGTTKASADGYWLFIKENVFKRGSKHTLWFRGVTQYYQNEMTYTITVT